MNADASTSKKDVPSPVFTSQVSELSHLSSFYCMLVILENARRLPARLTAVRPGYLYMRDLLASSAEVNQLVYSIDVCFTGGALNTHLD